MCSTPLFNFQMFGTGRYLLALLPAALPVSVWQLAWICFSVFGCRSDIKHMQNCYAGSFNLLPFIEFGLFWMQLASLIAVPASALMLLYVIAQPVGAHNGASDS